MAAAVPVAGPFRGGNAVVVRTHKVAAVHVGPGSTRLQASVWAGASVGRLGVGRCGNRYRQGHGCRCRGSGSESAGQGEDSGASSSGSNLDSGAESGPSAWDLTVSSKKMQAAAAKMGDPLRDMMTTVSKRLQDYLDNHRQTKLKAIPQPEVVEPEEQPLSEWDRWQKVFSEVEERESLASALKFQLEDAVDREDFHEAATLKRSIAAVQATDTVAEVMRELERALQEERYSDAARLRDKAGAGLVGWWAGLAEGDPFGRLVSISPAQGRLIGKSFTARQLAAGGPGIPLFEVFVTRSKSNEYELQAVYLRREGNAVAESPALPVKTSDADVVDIKNIVVDGEAVKKSEEPAPEGDVKQEPEEPDVNEGLKVIMNFLKDRMPDLKLKVFQIIAPEGAEADLPKIVEQLMEQEEEGKETKETGETVASSDDEATAEGSVTLDEKLPPEFLSAGNSKSIEPKETTVRLLLGGVLQNSGEDKVPKLPVRVPATIEAKSRDMFVFNIEDNGQQQVTPKDAAPSWKVAAVATRASANLMPDDIAKVFWNVDKVPVKVSKEMGEMIRLAVSQAQRRHGLQKSTTFTRINLTESASDPLCGLFIGAFGPYTSEVVQLKRKYGCWQEGGQSTGEKLEFFEYVEAVKLTGDLNVPAGEVTFRAKTGRESRLSHRAFYPEDLGVVARYKGQGKLAEPGFRNPHWIDGELVVLDGKSGHTNGAELGFLYSASERSFLVLFHRLKLHN